MEPALNIKHPIYQPITYFFIRHSLRPAQHLGVRRFKIFLALPVLLLLAGCGTSFKYRPSHAQSYTPISNNRGVAIIRGDDLRIDTTHPDWSRGVPAIVADALVDELKHNRIFQRVKIRGSLPKRSDTDYSHVVTFRIQQFEYHDESNALESLGRVALRAHGSEGPWIARSIPSKFVANVQVEFTVLDARTQQTVFTKSYLESESVRANAYQGETLQIEATSHALEKVVTRFVTDLSKLPLSRQ